MGFPLLEGSESTQEAGAGLGSVKRLTLKLEKCIRLTSVIQFSCTACRFLQLGMRETQLICFFTQLVGGFFPKTFWEKKSLCGSGGSPVDSEGNCSSGFGVFHHCGDTKPGGLQKGTGIEHHSLVTEFKWREPSSWVPVCSLI